MKNRKALFFDIDGTLFSESLRQVPQSAVLALKKTREKGNLVFINTGRTWCQNTGIRREVEVDGYCCGCGTYLIAGSLGLSGDTGAAGQNAGAETGLPVGSRVLYDRRIPRNRADRIKADIERFHLDAVLEGVDACWLGKGGPRMEIMRRIQQYMKAGGYGGPGDWWNADCDISKFCVSVDEHSEAERFFDTLPDFDIIDRGHGFYECVPAGHSKATIIGRVLKEYGVSREDAWVFGDSMNDLSMFQYAQNSVLMGVHDVGLEPYATFVTKTVEEDGIAYAMGQLGML